MSEPDRTDLEHRLLVVAPTGKDASSTKAVLGKAGLACALCRDIVELCREMKAGAGALLLTEEALALDKASCLVEELGKQPRWSDLPILLLTRGGPESRAALRAMETLGNVILLERPVRMSTLVTAARTALRARARQYENRDHLAKLHEADQRKDQFLAMLAHELRNPLAPVRNALQILRRPDVPAQIVAHAQEITERQVCHMARLIDDLMEVARVNQGKIQLKKEPMDLAAVVTRSVELTLPTINSRHHQVTLALPKEPLFLIADAARLEQVFVNLLTNAAKYTPPGGKIDVLARAESANATVQIRDTGVGIAPELLPHIFDLFVQAEQGPERTQGGLGVGLTLVKSIVELHGGSVEAQSAGPGCGSEFIVHLPGVKYGTTGLGQSGRPSATPQVPPKRVLVVDDNQDAADSMAFLLKFSGHDVITANDGVAAMATAVAFHPEVVLLDIGLPGMDGFEVARRIRGQEKGRDVLLIALTGYGQEEDRRRSAAAGFDHHLIKPIDLETLQRLLVK